MYNRGMKKNIVCIKCGETDESKFYPTSINKSDYRCKTCVNITINEWKRNNPEKVKAYARDWMRDWASKNREEYNEGARQWRKNHPQEQYEIRMRYYHKNKNAHDCQCKAFKEFSETQNCEVENCEELGERHHDDYSKPLEIRWFCKKHHKELHRLLT